MFIEAENPRTCRGQSREEKSVRTASGKLRSFKAFFIQTPFLIATLRTPKTLGGGTPPRGASIRRPSRVGVWDRNSSSIYRSLFPLFISPGSPGLTPSAAAICGAGASWRVLGRKNRVPRGLQKLIKFWCLFNIDFGASWLRFGGPRWLPKPSKIDKNRVSEAFCFRLVFYIAFWSIFTPNFDPLDLKKVYYSLGKTRNSLKPAFRR